MSKEVDGVLRISDEIGQAIERLYGLREELSVAYLASVNNTPYNQVNYRRVKTKCEGVIAAIGHYYVSEEERQQADQLRDLEEKLSE